MAQVRVYFEGHENLRTPLRILLEKTAPGQLRRRLKTISCGDRNSAIRVFLSDLKDQSTSGDVLLIDSESADDGRLFEHLTKQSDWRPPSGSPVSEEQVYWMVYCMESWFLADRTTLGDYYGKGFRESALPDTQNVEQIPVRNLLDALRAATRETTKGAYLKGSHAAALLQRLDPSEVVKAPNFRKLMTFLQSLKLR